MSNYVPAIIGGTALAHQAYRRWVRPKAIKKVSNTRLNRRLSRLERGYNKELKTLDTGTFASPTTTGQIIALTETAQGDTSLTREGLQIRPRNLQYKLYCAKNTSATLTLCRIIILLDKENTGTYPTATDFLETDATLSYTEHDTRPRYKIYKDFAVKLTTNNPTWFKKGIIKFPKNHKIWYSGTTAAEASNGKNAMFMYCVSNEATNYPTVNYNFRLRFTE